MSEEKDISNGNLKKITNSKEENNSFVPIFPEDKQAPTTKELQTKKDNPETGNMEFHHQPHHAPGKKKQFKTSKSKTNQHDRHINHLCANR